MDVLNGQAKNVTFEQCGPALDGVAVTPSDSTTLTPQVKALFVGTTGNVAVTTLGGTVLTFKNVPSGSILPVMVSKVMSTNTTATDIIALY